MRQLSKSKIIAFRQCPKRLWLEVHRPDLREDSAASQAKFSVGYQVGDIAQHIYDPEGTGAKIDVDLEGFETAFERSRALLETAEGPIFEAGLCIPGALAFADVMLPVKNEATERHAWRMIEVKSSTSLKDYHKDDIAVQAYIAIASGVELKGVALAHIDSNWVYPGGGDYRGLLKEIDLTSEALARAEEIATWIEAAQSIVEGSTAPDVAVGPQCTQPFECGFCRHCHPAPVETPFPLDWLPRLNGGKKAALLERNIMDMSQIPADSLNGRQKRVRDCTVNNRVWFDAEGAAKDLASFGFPAYFLDFETISFTIPIWKGTRPYEKIPFQFSLHVLDSAGQLSHQGFLDLSGEDPSEAFARELIQRCGSEGPVFVYNAGFEKGRICELANRFPHFAASLMAIHKRIVDLLPIARNRYYHPSQHGSWSIKSVLPAVCPDLRYSNLEGVQDGGMAMDAFMESIAPVTTPERKEAIQRELTAYCCLDTLAMVRLWAFFSGRTGCPIGSLHQWTQL
jgi:hypothetical protein